MSLACPLIGWRQLKPFPNYFRNNLWVIDANANEQYQSIRII
jgi:hypothetical protein